jgi:hypothetical protein
MAVKDPVKKAAYHKAYMARRYAEDPAHRARHIQRVGETKIHAKRAVAVLLAEFRKDGCAICPEKDPSCLDAHHLDPATKLFSLGRYNSASRAKTAAELAKCICLCSNCHRKFHAGKIKLPTPVIAE